ncbi:MAG: penicillin-binding transpeptidase domain-containing protein [Verrucomicrobiales bacterium]
MTFRSQRTSPVAAAALWLVAAAAAPAQDAEPATDADGVLVRRPEIVAPMPAPADGIEAIPEDGSAPMPAPAEAAEPEDDGSLELLLPPVVAPDLPEIEPPPAELKASLRTLANARTLDLAVPGPRGLIVDRNGLPLGQSEVRHYAALKFPHLGDDPPDQEILNFARTQFLNAGRVLGRPVSADEKDLLEHYKNRRWIPLLLSGLLTADEAERLQGAALAAVVAHPVYMRTYPQGELRRPPARLCRQNAVLSTGPIEDNEPIFEETEGRAGLELSFDADLQGKPGADQRALRRERREAVRGGHPPPHAGQYGGADARRPLPAVRRKRAAHPHAQRCLRPDQRPLRRRAGAGLSWARPTTRTTSSHSSRTTPTARWSTIRRNRSSGAPSRANTQPASTFKVMVAMVGLEAGKIDRYSEFPCPISMTIENRTMHNWNRKYDEGDMNVVDAIMRSCNTWFFQVGRLCGADSISSMAHRFGYGQPTGIPLPEKAGFIPTNEWAREQYGGRVVGAALANMSIGQGNVQATPLQVAQAMAAIANGQYTPRARLVRQIQDYSNTVTRAFPVAERNALNIASEHIAAVQKGMVNVVAAGNGTGKAASISAAQVAGKTGTAQWIKEGDGYRYLAWFAGFVPADNPEFAFAALYEGMPGEDAISGGKKAAPIVREVLTKVFEHKKKTEAELAEAGLEAPADAVPPGYEVADNSSSQPEEEMDDVRQAIADARKRRQEQSGEATAAEGEEGEPLDLEKTERESGLKRLWRRLRGR